MKPSLTSLPARAGIGLRQPHLDEIADNPRQAAWVEVHAENYMVPGGPRIAALERIRRDLPVSVHGVGLSLGSSEGIDQTHLERLRALVDRVEPAVVSEHFAWSVTDGVYLNDLLPLACTEEVLAVVARNVEAVQERLGRAILVENPSRYLTFGHATIGEPEFLTTLTKRTGCGLLLDVANVFVSANNIGTDPDAYLAGLPPDVVGEYHLAGHTVQDLDGARLLIDSHSSPVPDPVWELFKRALDRIGPRPTLIEWDTDLPALSVLLDEARRADGLIDEARQAHAA